MNKFTPLRDLVLGVLGFCLVFVLAGSLREDILSKLFFIVPQFYITFWLLLFVCHLLFAFGVARDAAAQNTTKQKAYFVAPFVWGLATMVGGFFIVIVYWVFHHSTLRRD